MHLPGIKAPVRVLAVAAAVATSAVVPTAGGAQAVPSDRCPEGYVCFWTGPNFTGTMTVFENPSGLNDCDAINPAARTVFNNDDQTWNFYRDTSCRAYAYTLDPGQYNDDTTVHSWI
ncbi:peptidase inhibitor family I36 protein [Streptomyces sp. NBC_01808]|uniref:peptidase inhibitor family I36 protein n=1 Tax=Streptomyces sp. NBC_01808 TaxID=2975947 RepID=UPI002DDB7F5E|nr:peptidase inhibitor family I36 protein [Streptomyces sp. NBC_01808]WSA40686.1 peptidase inhibitor family I36 protein [Streptomyces sp. NBC_01808]